MADIKRFIPFVLKWETSVEIKKGEHLEDYYKRCTKKGYANDPMDRGGATMCGVTITTYNTYLRKVGRPAAHESDMKNLTYKEWYAIIKTMFWDRWKADDINNQSIAELLVDFVWASGTYGIRYPQKALGVIVDGKVGPLTIAAINKGNQRMMFANLKRVRVNYILSLVNKSVAAYEKKIGRKATEKEKLAHTQYKFKKGWLRRVNSINYFE